MNIVTALTVNNAEQAIDFYKDVFNAEVLGEIVYLDTTPGFEDEKYEGLIVHSAIKFGNTTLFINDQIEEFYQKEGRTIQLCVFLESMEELKERFGKLQVDGEVEREIEEEHWGATSGSIKDKFDIVWHLYYNK